MKQLFFYFLIAASCSPNTIHAQFLERIGNRIEEKADDRVNQKADEAIGKGLDKAEEILSAHQNNNEKNAERIEEQLAASSTHGDCGNFYLLTRHSLAQMKVYDKNNRLSLTMNYRINKVTPLSHGKETQVQIEVFDENGKKMSTANAVYKCVNGTLLMDMSASMPYQGEQKEQMRAQGEEQRAFLQYPPDMSVGQQLPDARFTMRLQQQGSIISSAMFSATQRQVEAREKITTPAGSWNCFRISYTAKTQVAFASFRYQVTEWFAPGFGIVRSVSRNKKGKITGRSELTKIQ
jgi:hypothetical protein